MPEYDFREDDQTQDDARMRALAIEVKIAVQESSSNVEFLGKVQFGLYQCCHIWGFVLLLCLDFTNSEAVGYFIKVVVIIGTYHYF